MKEQDHKGRLRETMTGCGQRTRREFLAQTGMCMLAAAASPEAVAQGQAGGTSAGGMNILEFQRELKRMRFAQYQHPRVDILKDGFRPVGGKIADFAAARHNGRDHFFYIERRLQEGTPSAICNLQSSIE